MLIRCSKVYTSNLKLVCLLLIVILGVFGDNREPKCSFTGGWIRDASQKGDPWPDPQNSMTPVSQVLSPKLPTTSAAYIDQICPFMSGKELCCNDDQILVMYNNFKTIDSLFGNCLLCSTNLKRFWCEYTCSPYQYYFVDSFDQIKTSDVDYPVLNQSMRVQSNVVWDLYNSCKKNPYVATLASGQSAVGFLEFMGSNAVQTGKVKISFDYSSDPLDTLVMDMYPCDMEVEKKLDGYDIEQWTCNYCEAACKPNKIQAYPSFFDGFNIIVVAIVYACLIIISVIIHFVKKKWNSNNDDIEDTFEIKTKHKLLENWDSEDSKNQEKIINGSHQSLDKSQILGRINQSSLIKSVDMSKMS